MTQIIRLPDDEVGKRALLYLYRGSCYLDGEAEAIRAASLGALDDIDDEWHRWRTAERAKVMEAWRAYLGGRLVAEKED